MLHYYKEKEPTESGKKLLAAILAGTIILSGGSVVAKLVKSNTKDKNENFLVASLEASRIRREEKNQERFQILKGVSYQRKSISMWKKRRIEYSIKRIIRK